jgi:hypothetical protein
MKRAFTRIIVRIGNLITIKSIVTLILTCMFTILALRGVIDADQVIVIYSTIIAFYFGTQSRKNEDKGIVEDVKDIKEV